MDLDLIARKDRRIARAMLAVLQDLSVHPSRDHIARTANLESTHFSKRFKDVVGVTFAFWNRSVRVDAAGRLLATTDRQIRDISAAVGYSNTTTFERAFRKMTGMCPSDYRAMNLPTNPQNAERNPPNAESELSSVP